MSRLRSVPHPHVAVALLLGLLLPPGALPAAQDVNVHLPIATIEALLRKDPLDVLDMQQARPQIEGDRSARVALEVGDGGDMLVAKWKPVGRGAIGFNNEPRYELAAYEFQKLFLTESEYVVPPTVLRSMPLEAYRELRAASQPTLPRTNSVLYLLSYWVQNVTNRDPFQADRFERDTVYARHWGNANLFTYLINHRDANLGNILVSIEDVNPRVFAVDNDVAFRSRVSDQGDTWRRLHVDRLPHATIERLRAVTRDALDRALGVVAEFAIVDGHLVPAEPGPNLDPARGLRTTAERVQFGLTSAEIGDIEGRIRRILEQVDRGRLRTF
jgi:hypothetical protein